MFSNHSDHEGAKMGLEACSVWLPQLSEKNSFLPSKYHAFSHRQINPKLYRDGNLFLEGFGGGATNTTITQS